MQPYENALDARDINVFYFDALERFVADSGESKDGNLFALVQSALKNLGWSQLDMLGQDLTFGLAVLLAYRHLEREKDSLLRIDDAMSAHLDHVSSWLNFTFTSGRLWKKKSIRTKKEYTEIFAELLRAEAFKDFPLSATEILVRVF